MDFAATWGLQDSLAVRYKLSQMNTQYDETFVNEQLESKRRNQGVHEYEISLIFANGNVYRYLTGSIDFLLMNFKTILSRFIFSIITEVDHIPFLAKVSCYLTFIKHALKHTQTRTHLCREPCRQTDTQTDRHTRTHILCIALQTDRQTDIHTFAENCTDTHTHTHTHTHRHKPPPPQQNITDTLPDRQTHTHTHTHLMQRMLQTDRQTDRQTHTHLCREPYRQTHTHTDTYIHHHNKTLQTHSQTDKHTRAQMRVRL